MQNKNSSEHKTIQSKQMMMNSMILSRRSPMSTQDRAIKALGSAKSLNISSRQDTRWIGGYDFLPEVPTMYPIERTNTIVDCSDPQVIAERIFHCLQKLSITAFFNASDVSSLNAAFVEDTIFTRY
jgi:hypothetical protein